MLTDERFEALAAKYIDMVYRVAFGALKNREDAEDVTQEAFAPAQTACLRHRAFWRRVKKMRRRSMGRRIRSTPAAARPSASRPCC